MTPFWQRWQTEDMETERHVCTYRIFPGQDQCISEEFDGTGAGGEGAARYI